MAIAGVVTVGVLAAAFDYSTKIFFPILDISRFYALAQASLSAGERIFSLIDETVDIKDEKGATDFNKIKGDIKFENVTFQYVEGKPVLKDLGLHIKAGQSIALVGPTGEGKTTIVNLIGRFYEPTTGRIVIDGEDYKEKTLNSLRGQMGTVLQTPHLFSGTIRENIRFANPECEEKEVEEALLLLGADAFIKRLDEEVGENGELLSEGEKQLVSFARAIIAKPAIFIMDEATSSIDTLTEAKIQAGVEHIISSRTSIIIAHRLSTIKNCDRILVIQKGKIAEDGNHDELIAKGGIHHELYTKQFRGDLVEEMTAV